MGIGQLYTDVHEFHRVFDHPAHFSPVLQPADRAIARADWIDEEVAELRDATTIYAQADAYLDIIYFAVGGLVEMGVEPSKLWDIVHGANMAKVFPDGTVKRREDGKILKPPHWRAPDEAQEDEINMQIARASEGGLFDSNTGGLDYGQGESMTGKLPPAAYEHAGGVADEAVQAVEPDPLEALQARGRAAAEGVAAASRRPVREEPRTGSGLSEPE